MGTRWVSDSITSSEFIVEEPLFQCYSDFLKNDTPLVNLREFQLYSDIFEKVSPVSQKVHRNKDLMKIAHLLVKQVSSPLFSDSIQKKRCLSVHVGRSFFEFPLMKPEQSANKANDSSEYDETSDDSEILTNEAIVSYEYDEISNEKFDISLLEEKSNDQKTMQLIATLSLPFSLFPKNRYVQGKCCQMEVVDNRYEDDIDIFFDMHLSENGKDRFKAPFGKMKDKFFHMNTITASASTTDLESESFEFKKSDIIFEQLKKSSNSENEDDDEFYDISATAENKTIKQNKVNEKEKNKNKSIQQNNNSSSSQPKQTTKIPSTEQPKQNTNDPPNTQPEQNIDDSPDTQPEQNIDDPQNSQPEQNTNDSPDIQPEQNIDDSPDIQPEQNTNDSPDTQPEQNTDDSPDTQPEQNTDDSPNNEVTQTANDPEIKSQTEKEQSKLDLGIGSLISAEVQVYRPKKKLNAQQNDESFEPQTNNSTLESLQEMHHSQTFQEKKNESSHYSSEEIIQKEDDSFPSSNMIQSNSSSAEKTHPEEFASIPISSQHQKFDRDNLQSPMDNNEKIQNKETLIPPSEPPQISPISINSPPPLPPPPQMFPNSPELNTQNVFEPHNNAKSSVFYPELPFAFNTKPAMPLFTPIINSQQYNSTISGNKEPSNLSELQQNKTEQRIAGQPSFDYNAPNDFAYFPVNQPPIEPAYQFMDQFQEVQAQENYLESTSTNKNNSESFSFFPSPNIIGTFYEPPEHFLSINY